MFVLGIDPGLSRCGYGVVEQRGNRQRAVAAGVVRTQASDTVPDRLAELQAEMRLLIGQYRPEVVAVERVLFQTNVRTAMGVGQASGIVMAEAITAGCTVVEYSPNEIKSAIAGDGSADKDQMEHMVRLLLGIAKPLRPVDAADALGVALCYLAHHGVPAGMGA
jgi:crossover junction endodeoxyribonuclease RuvC